MSMPESNFDPSGSTQQFRAFAKRAEERPRAQRGRSVLVIGLGVAVAMAVAVLLLLLLR